jgi:hypothetical protein
MTEPASGFFRLGRLRGPHSKSIIDPGILLVCTLVTLVAGCGLSEYEDRIKEEQGRLKRIEDENRILGEPVDLPQPMPGDKSMPALQECQLFFRPPRTLQIDPAVNAFVAKSQQLRLYPYKGTEKRLLLLGAVTAPLSEKDFQKDVWQAFENYETKRAPHIAVPSEMPKVKIDERYPIQITKESPMPIRYKSFVWDEPASAGWEIPDDDGQPKKAQALSRFFFHLTKREGDNTQVVVIYQVPKTKVDEQLLTGIDASLKSLATGVESFDKRELYMRWKNKS